MKKIAFVFPGQGAQYVGMGKEFYNEFQFVKNLFHEADNILGFKISEMILNGDEKELSKTENTQPALLIVSTAILTLLKEKNINPDMVAGLSLGEYSALVCAGALSFKDGLMLVRKRGELMAKAMPEGKGAMAAILGAKKENVEKLCEKSSCKGIIEIANYNCPGQIVISGAREAIGYAIEISREFGVLRAIPLKVSGAFHCSLLDDASKKLQLELENIEINELKIPYVTNVTGEVVSNNKNIKNLLKNGVKSSVLWEQSVNEMINNDVDIFIEVGSGKVLSGFIKKINRKVKVLNTENLQDFNEVLEFLGRK